MRQTDVFSHTYAAATEHSIRFYGSGGAITLLNCYASELTSLDVNQNKELFFLLCHSNRILSLDVSGCTALSYVRCSGNFFVTDSRAIMKTVNSLPDRRGTDMGNFMIENMAVEMEVYQVCNEKNWKVI